MKKFYIGLFSFMVFLSFAIIFIATPIAIASNLPNEVRLTTEEYSSSQPIQIPGSKFVKQNIGKKASVGDEGSRYVELRLFGLVPIKKVKVDILPFSEVIIGGDLIGFRAKIDGVLVTNDNKELNLRKGDIINSVDKVSVNSVQEFNDILTIKKDGEITIEGERGNGVFTARIEVEKFGSLGVFLKDETSGIGTITYINPENNNFASLGHRMNDFETATHVDLRGGTVHSIDVVGIEKNTGKKVGSYKSVLNQSKKGDILTSNNFGVFGCMGEVHEGRIHKVTSRYNVKPGKAQIRSTCPTSGQVREFDVEIVKTRFQKKPSTKSMIIRITDKDLLKETGGIIHGMSGSPIIQNGRVVGALTHVILGDFAKGYGIYIDFIMP